MCANNEGSGETRGCAGSPAFAGRLCDKYHNHMSWLICRSPSSFQKPLDHSKSNFMWDLHGIKAVSFFFFFFFSNGLGHETKMAAMPIYAKTIKNMYLFFSKPTGRKSWNLVYNKKDSDPTKFVEMIMLGWPWPLRQVQMLPDAFVSEKMFKHYCRFYRNYWSVWTESWY